MMTNDGLNRLGTGSAFGASAGSAASAKPTGQKGAQEAQEAQSSAAFRALLEKFEANAEELKRRADDLEGPDSLKEAVSSARRSINEALVLGGDLLEAYRAAQQRVSAPESGANQHVPKEGPGGGR